MNTLIEDNAMASASVLALLLLALGGSLPAHAQDDEDAERSWHLGVALGYGERDNPLLKGETIDIHAVIDFSWYGKRFFFDNGDLGYTLQEHNTWSLSLIGTVNNERHYYSYLTGNNFGLESILDSRFGLTGNASRPEPGGLERPASPALAQSAGLDPQALEPPGLNSLTELPDRDFAFNSGLELLYISPLGDVQAQLLSDLSSTHNGQEAWLSWSKPWYTPLSEFTLTLGLEWKSSNLVDYYYGVRPEEAFNGRPQYEAGAGANHFIRFAARHRLGDQLSLVGMVEREFLSSAISNSPIVDKADVDTFFAGLYYQF
ncbi:MAG TPA: MipA/OmpV family protein [Pseudomonadaceae bacterium]|nr:MipA/OmpV family protein [Pseudomonadaceae bacterium]